MDKEKVNKLRNLLCRENILKQIGKIFLIGCVLCVMSIAMARSVSADTVATGSFGEKDENAVLWSLDSDGTLNVYGKGEMLYIEVARKFGDQYKDQVKKIVVSEGVTKIVDYGFYGYELLETVVLADSVTEIGEYAFCNCPNLSSLTMGGNVSVIEEAAFYDCTNLQSVVIPGGCSVERSAFSECQNLEVYVSSGAKIDSLAFGYVTGFQLKSLTFEDAADIPTDYSNLHKTGKAEDCGPETLTIKSGAISNATNYFKYCGRLKTLILEEGVTEIAGDAFYATGITKLQIPDSLKTIGAEAFRFCESLKKVYGGKNLASIGRYAFEECSALKSVSLSMAASSVIDECAFAFCTSLKSIDIPDGVVEIGANAFCGCTSLSAVNLPDSLTTVGHDAFYGCTSLKKVTIPKSVVSIGNHAFGMNETSSSTEKGSLVIIGFVIYGYSGTEAEAYAKSENITFILVGNTSSASSLAVGKTFKSSGGVYKVTKTGAEVSYQKTTKTTAETVTIPSTVKMNGVTLKVTSIGKNAFSGNKYLTSVTIGGNVRSIGDNAFANCKKLKKVVIKSTKLTTIGRKAFYGDKLLSSITLKTTKLKKVGANAFKGIKSNAVIHVPSNCLNTYKELLKGKGQGKKVKITK